MPDTEANQERWPQSSSQKPGCGFPLMRYLGLFCLSSGALIASVQGHWRQAEGRLVLALLAVLEKGDLLLGDRGFCSYANMATLLAGGIDSVFRHHQRRKINWRQGQRLGPGDRIIKWKRSPRSWSGLAGKDERYETLPEDLQVRVIKYRVNVPGFRTEEVVLVTTLLDPMAYPAEALQKLYFQRWDVELQFEQIKVQLKMDVLRCKSPEMTQREVMLHEIAYNLVRSVMQDAAAQNNVPLRRISFKGTLDTMRSWSASLHALRYNSKQQRELYSEMLTIIAADLVPLRPGRVEPRVKKRRPKNYHLLTKPRHEMYIPPHRNRPKPALS